MLLEYYIDQLLNIATKLKDSDKSNAIIAVSSEKGINLNEAKINNLGLLQIEKEIKSDDEASENDYLDDDINYFTDKTVEEIIKI